MINESIIQKDIIVLNATEYYITDVNLKADSFVDDNFFGTAVAKKLTFKISNNIDLEKKEFVYRTYINNVKYEMGSYIVYEIKDSDTFGMCEIVAYDYMIKSDIKYVSSLNYASNTIKISDILNEACALSGITLGTTNYANMNFIVDSNQILKDDKVRDIFKYVAQMAGAFATILNDNKLYLISPNKTITSKGIIDPGMYQEIDIKTKLYPINTVVIGNSQVEGENVTKRKENVEEENCLIVYDNPFAYTQLKRESLIQELFTKVVDFEYYPFSLSGIAQPQLQLGDRIQIKNKNGDILDSYVFSYIYKSPGGLDCEIESQGITKNTIGRPNDVNILEKFKRAEIIVDKAENNIKLIVQEQNVIKDRLNDTTTLIESTKEDLMLDIEGLKNTFTKYGGTNLIKNSSGQFDKDNWKLVADDNTPNYDVIQNTDVKNNFIAMSAFRLNTGTVKQNISVINGIYNLSFKYRKLLDLASCKIKINDKEIELTSLEYKEENITLNVTTNIINIELISSNDATCIIGDLMLIAGNEKQVYRINENESISTTVKISNGIEVKSSISEINAEFGNDGVRIRNINTKEVTSEFTKDGTVTANIVASKGNLAGCLVQNVAGQIWFS